MPDQDVLYLINDQAVTKQGHLPTEWLAFWAAYPKKDGKEDARKAWKKIKLAKVPAIMAAIETRRNTRDWTKEKGQYIPLPASFLRGRRWEDESTNVNSGQGTGKPNGGGKFAAYNRTAASLREQ